MGNRFVNIKHTPQNWKAKNDKIPQKRISKTKAIAALKEARKFIAFFNGTTEQIDVAITYLQEQ